MTALLRLGPLAFEPVCCPICFQTSVLELASSQLLLHHSHCQILRS